MLTREVSDLRSELEQEKVLVREGKNPNVSDLIKSSEECIKKAKDLGLLVE
jgi:hypothetical protein